jgi:NAD(P)-dependent dehydrogenase (short-subunit alcohol dehydrogenase family)
MTFASYPSLRDRPVFVTGGATGIGADIVRAFAGQGARVGFVDVQAEAGTLLAGQCPGSAFRTCDISDIPALEAAIAALAQQLGDFAVLVNNAANDTRADIDEITVESWDASMAVNLRPHFFAARAVHRGMAARGGGSIVNLSSIAWRLGSAEMAHYNTAKAGIVGLTKSLARAFGKDNIRVNCIEPGAVMTERQRRLWYPDQASVDSFVQRQSLHHVLLGDEVARMALFLAAEDSRMISKQTFVVDGGIS